MTTAQTTLQATIHTIAAAYGIVAASIVAVLNDWKNGYFTLLVPEDVSDMRRARVTAYCTKDGIGVRINVAPGRVEGSGTRVTAYQHIGAATPDNAAKAIVLANEWDSKAMSQGFAVSGFGAALDGMTTKWVRRGGKGRTRRNASSNPFGVTTASGETLPNDKRPETTVDIIAGMSASASANVEAPNVEAANVEAPNVEAPNVEAANVEAANVERETVGAGTSGKNRNRR